MAHINTKISSLCMQWMNAFSLCLQSHGRPMSTAIKCLRYQVCPPKKNAYQIVSKITPQLLEQIQKKSLGAGILQPGRLPRLFNSHPLTLPLVSPCERVENLLNPEKNKKASTESRCYFRTSAVTFKKGKKNKCKKKKKKKKKCKKKGKKKGKKEKKRCKLQERESPCPDIKMTNCEPTDSKLCTRDSAWPDCERKCAPYPSYSESCHKDPEYPPSECRICPWTVENHPTYKEKPRKYHTSSSNAPISDGPLDGRCLGVRLPPFAYTPLPPSPEEDTPLIGDVLPSLGMLCKCGKDNNEECGKKVKTCKKKKKKKKKKKRDKCKKSKKQKKEKKKKKKKRNCNLKWKHPPCEKPVSEPRICPPDLIKKPKCP